MSFETWMAFVLGAVLSWGVYVPVLHEGQSQMGGGAPSAGAVRAFLCVGLAYFVTAVVIPLIALQFGLAGDEPLSFKTKDGNNINTGALMFSTLGGIAGAAGALCIIFAIKNDGKPLYVAPLVFAGAPIVNAIVSVIWKPPLDASGPQYTKAWVMFGGGILLAACGAGLVLYSKGVVDQINKDAKKAKAASMAQPIAQATPETGIRPS